MNGGRFSLRSYIHDIWSGCKCDAMKQNKAKQNRTEQNRALLHIYIHIFYIIRRKYKQTFRSKCMCLGRLCILFHFFSLCSSFHCKRINIKANSYKWPLTFESRSCMHLESFVRVFHFSFLSFHSTKKCIFLHYGSPCVRIQCASHDDILHF